MVATQERTAATDLPQLTHENLLLVSLEAFEVLGAFSFGMMRLLATRTDLIVELDDIFSGPAKQGAGLEVRVSELIQSQQPDPPVERPIEQEEFEDADEECDE